VRLRAAREALLTGGDLAAAANGLNECMSWIGHIAEPWFMLGLISFANGDFETAAELVAKRGAAQSKAGASLGLLDPCEIAWLMLLGWWLGDRDLVAEMTKSAAATSHVSIRRVQWLIDGAENADDLAAAGLAGPRPGDCLSIHWLGDEDFDSWTGLILRGRAAREQATAKAA